MASFRGTCDGTPQYRTADAERESPGYRAAGVMPDQREIARLGFVSLPQITPITNPCSAAKKVSLATLRTAVHHLACLTARRYGGQREAVLQLIL